MNLSEIQLSRSAVQHNLAALKKLSLEGTRFVAVVKGNAYGHGVSEIVGMLEGNVDSFQVDDVEELRQVRQLSDLPILVLGYVQRSDISEAVGFGGELALYDFERLDALAEATRQTGRTAKVHIKVDALLGRQGLLPADMPALAEALLQRPEIQVRSIYAHFANIEDTTDLGHAQRQIDAFDEAIATLSQAGLVGLQRHVSATSGLMTVEQGNQMVRIGLGLYGMYPSASLARTHSDLGLKPVVRWVSHLAQVKVLPARHPVGYGLTYITPREMRIGIVPQGYADGYDRGLSSSGEVLVRGVRCSVLGRVAMNMFAVDLSAVPNAQAEDEVVLLGDQGTDRISAEEVALRLGTINYEVTTRITPLLPRRVV